MYEYPNRESIARHSDPDTSHIAAKAITESGTRRTQKQRVLEGPKLYPGRTSAELSDLIDLERHLVARRLPDLERDGLAKKIGKRPCHMTGLLALIWGAIEIPGA